MGEPFYELQHDALEILTNARDRITDPGAWYQHALYLYAKGDDGVTGDEVVAMCAMGAVHWGLDCEDQAHQRALDVAVSHLRKAAVSLVDPDPLSNPISWLNDHTDHETVMLMFKTAINDLESS